ncbi:MAG: SEL1-like repeat protein [Gammaproteobacteria bacterium]|nr:SEL1-like repeat protein [Gammaproteobacteria bacterium]
MLKNTVFGLVLLLGNSLAATVHADPGNSLVGTSYQPLLVYQEALNYLLGRNGKQKSAEKAAALFKALAESNWSSAQHMLGNMYFSGKGVEKNDLLAYKWLSIASRNNIRLAEAIADKRKQLKSRLSSKHLQKVEQWIADWKPSPIGQSM